MGKLPQVRSVNLVSAEGVLVNDATVRGSRVIDVSDRLYFQRILAGERSVTLTEPIFSRTRESWFFGMALPLHDDDGGLIGVVILGIEPNYFLEFFSSAAARDQNIALLSARGVIAAARVIGDPAPPIGQGLDGLPTSEQTEFANFAPFGHGIASVIPVGGWPLTVVVHKPTALVLAQVVAPVLSIALVMMVAMAAIARWLPV